MAMTIVQELCTVCGDCMPVCPTGAVQKKKGTYVIDAATCTECEGEFDDPQCIMECAVDDCIVPI